MRDGNLGAAELRYRSNQSSRVQFVDRDDGRSLWDRFDERWPSTLTNAAAALLAVAITWFLLRVNVSPALMAVPGGSVASIFMLYVAGVAAGRAVAMIGGMPPLLGMMVAGIALQNCGLYTVTAQWCIHLVTIMRCAFLTILIFHDTHYNPYWI